MSVVNAERLANVRILSLLTGEAIAERNYKDLGLSKTNKNQELFSSIYGVRLRGTKYELYDYLLMTNTLIDAGKTRFQAPVYHHNVMYNIS